MALCSNSFFQQLPWLCQDRYSLPTKLLYLVLVMVVSFLIFQLTYRLYFHPLVRFAGPKYAAISHVAYSFWFLGGRQPFKMLDLHRRYGSVVRTAPNELSFNTARSWKDIYGVRQGVPTFRRSIFYEGGSFADQYGSIVSERDPSKHSQMRKYLSSASSQQSLVEQEDLVREMVERFLTKLSKFASDNEAFDAVRWFNMLTFDIIGDSAFGETFNGIESGEVHPWITRILGSLTQGTLADSFKRFPNVTAFAMKLFSGAIDKAIEDTKINERYSIQLVSNRIERNTSRKDFMTRFLEARKDAKIPDIQIAAHASDFVLAGSETTATALSTLVYHLDKSSAIKERLRKEIREKSKSRDEITLKSTAELPYLTAVICETMRIYPPLPFGLPRDIPPGGTSVDGHWVPSKCREKMLVPLHFVC